MFEQPIKGDLDRSLSAMMHEARHRLMIEKNRIMAEATMAGALQSNRVIVTVASFADQIHDAAMKQTTPLLLAFIERMHLPPAEITSWARPHLENLGNSLLGVIPPNGFPNDHQRIVAQYHAVFQQRLDGVLRDVEIGFVKGAGFARAEQVESKDNWISAAAAIALLTPSMSPHSAAVAICSRAHAGLIRARAERFVTAERGVDNAEVPAPFWWAEGHEALTQDWKTGDFETWINQTVHLQAFGVSFLRSQVEKLIPDVPLPAAPSVAPGGRRPADWWEDLLIEICFRNFRGELKPKTQADIQRAMQDWITQRGYSAAESTVRIRARKVWTAIKRDAEN